MQRKRMPPTVAIIQKMQPAKTVSALVRRIPCMLQAHEVMGLSQYSCNIHFEAAQTRHESMCAHE